MSIQTHLEELKGKLKRRQELIVDMELSGIGDNKSQILYKKTKKQIAELKAKIAEAETMLSLFRDEINSLGTYWTENGLSIGKKEILAQLEVKE